MPFCKVPTIVLQTKDLAQFYPFFVIADPTVEKRLENLYNRFKMMLVRQDDASRRSVVAILRLINETLEEKGTIIGREIDLCVTTCKVTKCSGKVGSLVH